MARTSSHVFTDNTTDLRPSNAAAHALMYIISPEYFHAAGTALLSGRTSPGTTIRLRRAWQSSTRSLPAKSLAPQPTRSAKYYKSEDGTRIQVVGIVEDGKYASLTEDPQSVMFLPILQSPLSQTCLVVRSRRDPQQLAAAMRSKVRDLDAGLPVYIQTWNEGMEFVLFGPRMATISLGVLGVMGAMLSITGIFGMAAYSVSKRLNANWEFVSLSARSARKCCRQRWDAHSNCSLLVPRRDCSSEFWRAGCSLSSCIRQRRAIPSYWPALSWR